MDSTKEFSQSKYDRHNFHKCIHIDPFFASLGNKKDYNMNKYNNPACITSATVKHPYYCPIGAKCRYCRHNGKGLKKHNTNNIFNESYNVYDKYVN